MDGEGEGNKNKGKNKGRNKGKNRGKNKKKGKIKDEADAAASPVNAEGEIHGRVFTTPAEYLRDVRGTHAIVLTINNDDPDDLTTVIATARSVLDPKGDPGVHLFVLSHVQPFRCREAPRAARDFSDTHPEWVAASAIFPRLAHAMLLAEGAGVSAPDASGSFPLHERVHFFALGAGSPDPAATVIDDDALRGDGGAGSAGSDDTDQPLPRVADPREYLSVVEAVELETVEECIRVSEFGIPAEFVDATARGGWRGGAGALVSAARDLAVRELEMRKIVDPHSLPVRPPSSAGGLDLAFFDALLPDIHTPHGTGGGGGAAPRTRNPAGALGESLARVLRRFDAVELFVAGGMGRAVTAILRDPDIPWRGARLMFGAVMSRRVSAEEHAQEIARVETQPWLRKRWFQATNCLISDPDAVETLFDSVIPRIGQRGGAVLVMTSDAAKGEAAVPGSPENLVFADDDLAGILRGARAGRRGEALARVYARWASMSRRGTQIIFDDVLAFDGSVLGKTPAQVLEEARCFSSAGYVDLYRGSMETGHRETFAVVGVLPKPEDGGGSPGCPLEADIRATRCGGGRMFPWGALFSQRGSLTRVRSSPRGIVAILKGAPHGEMRERYIASVTNTAPRKIKLTERFALRVSAAAARSWNSAISTLSSFSRTMQLCCASSGDADDGL